MSNIYSQFPKEPKMNPDTNNEVAGLREENANLRNILNSFVLVSPIEAERMEKMEEDYLKLTSIADRACNLLNLKGGYHESHQLRDEIEALKKNQK
jgi:hypothetical protein